ncbi:MAG: DUF362 domain-containing protein [Candidatus Lokiarchaeota archaeon]|nr:DUF362 domain-containing protein [Candidatus Lokiarchaeota archaeon]
MTIKNNTVAVEFFGTKDYPRDVPFHPPVKYPEYDGTEVDPKNNIYDHVRQVLYKIGLDKENFNKPNWNPYKDIVKPGMTVFIKPNTVRHYHLDGKEVFSIIIHASILRPILDYVLKALNGSGKIIIGDSQVIFGRFDEAYSITQIDKLLDWVRKDNPKIPIECFDLRMVQGVRTWMYGKWGREKIEKDPLGYTWVNLGDKSAFKDIDPKRLRIGISSYKVMYKHHSNGKHEYLIPNSFLQSDVVIGIPKFKTHRRTAITLAQKNYFGIPALKDTMPHFITGAASEGGDQYINPSFRKRIVLKLHDQIQSNPFIPIKFACAVIKKIIWNSSKIIPFKDDIYEAMWYGNDTLWRTLQDLNRIVFYSNKDGKICDTPQKNHFTLIDGIIGGEKSGPVSPDPVYPGLLMAGFNALALDTVGASIMGFDHKKIPLISKTFETSSSTHPLFFGNIENIKILDGDREFDLATYEKHRNLNFEPHPNWKGHIERSK